MKKLVLSFLSLALVFAFCAAGVFAAEKNELDEISALLPFAEQEPIYELPKNNGLDVFFCNNVSEANAGEWMTLEVYRDGELLTSHDYTFEVVYGRDIAEAYPSVGEVLAFGSGSVVIKVYLDAEPGVYGFAAIDFVMPSEENPLLALRSQSGQTSMDGEFELAISEFPESYKPYLRELHAKYPSWVFEPFYTTIDFSNAVYNESIYDRNLTLRVNFADVLKSKAEGDFDRATGEYVMKDTGWVSVNAIPLVYFMDARNFLYEKAVFPFERLTYDSRYHTKQGVDAILNNSFMCETAASYLDTNGNEITTQTTYADAIMSAAQSTGLSPYYIAAKIRGEIGSTPSNSANGVCPGYEGYYNFYNIGATDGEGNIERGLEFAKSGESYNRPWTSPEKSILGGAMYIAEQYINGGQFTGYLMNFNVNPDGDSELYTHQYQTNVSAAVSQGVSTYNGYADNGALSEAIVFSIPIYDNMPDWTTKIDEFVTNQKGIVNHTVVVRSGPSAAHEGGDMLLKGQIVSIKRSAVTDADHYRTRLTYPFWYEVEYIVDGETKSGYVAAEFINSVVSSVLRVGDTVELSASLNPAEATDRVFYLSENNDVATVSDDGVITAKGRGTATIVAFTSGGALVEKRVAVMDALPTADGEISDGETA